MEILGVLLNAFLVYYLLGPLLYALHTLTQWLWAPSRPALKGRHVLLVGRSTDFDCSIACECARHGAALHIVGPDSVHLLTIKKCVV